ncbi:hypothetical protein EV363DRAFT_1310005 [Boletus edulis]|nr:hypothetical protein EV363DRAFT_1310005 [Boletus edulis]
MGGGFTLNVSVTLAIARRLWWMSRTIAFLTGTSTNRFATVVLALYENPAALTGLDVAAQLVALAPFLIVVQLGVIGRYRDPMGSRREQNSPTDVPLHMAVLPVYDTL